MLLDPHILLRDYVKMAESMFMEVSETYMADDALIEYASGVKIPYESRISKEPCREPCLMIHRFGVALLARCANELLLVPELETFSGRVPFGRISSTYKGVSLIWRVRPELEITEDFETKEMRYALYTCFKFGSIGEK